MSGSDSWPSTKAHRFNVIKILFLKDVTCYFSGFTKYIIGQVPEVLDLVYKQVFIGLGVVLAIGFWRSLNAFTKMQRAVGTLIFALFFLGNGSFPILSQAYSPRAEVTGNVADLREEGYTYRDDVWYELFVSRAQRTVGPLFIFETLGNQFPPMNLIHGTDEVYVQFSTWDNVLRNLAVIGGPNKGLTWKHDDRLIQSKVFLVIGSALFLVGLFRIKQGLNEPPEPIPPEIKSNDVLRLGQ